MFRTYFLLPLLIPLAFVKRDFFGGIFHPLGRLAARLSAKPRRAVFFVGLVSFLLSMGMSLLVRIPIPHVNDEFGYLLLADTFAHGRVTNPTPPLPEHFDTIYEITRPTYTSIYPPAQGVMLAIGQRLGLPIIGIWLAAALACAAVCWMLLAWMPAPWALAGGLMVALHPLVLQWTQTYWGGAVAMAGGALVIGAFRRILREPRVHDALWMGVGLGVLANSRPYEGFILGMLVLLALTFRMVAARDIPLSSLFRRLVLPLAAMLVLLGLQIGYYDWRVTGHPALMPHILNDQTYTIAPQFLFGTPRQEPNYGYPEIRRIYEGYLESFLSQRGSFGAVMRATANKIGILAQGYLWSFLMVVALLGLPWALARDPWLRGVLLIGLLFLVGQLATSWLFPHYAAPAAGLFFLLVISAMRSLYLWRGFSAGTARSGRNIVRGLAILFVISYCQIAARMRSEDTVQWFTERQALLDTLRNRPEKTLLFVKYDPNHNPNREWVYNDADIVHAKVILARDLGAQKNRELLDYFPDRNAWMVCADAPVPILQPYPGS